MVLRSYYGFHSLPPAPNLKPEINIEPVLPCLFTTDKTKDYNYKNNRVSMALSYYEDYVPGGHT